MNIARRQVLLGGVAMALLGPSVAAAMKKGSTMYGMIGKMRAQPGQRGPLVAILLGSTGAMPGCLSYIVATDPKDAEAIWITEAWDSKESHDASLALPAVKEAIAKARPLIAGFDSSVETVPLGGVGMPR